MIREAPSAPSREELIALVAALMAENAALKARIAEARIEQFEQRRAAVERRAEEAGTSEEPARTLR